MIRRIGYGKAVRECLKYVFRQGGHVITRLWEHMYSQDNIAKKFLREAYSISMGGTAAMPPRTLMARLYPEPSPRGAPR